MLECGSHPPYPANLLGLAPAPALLSPQQLAAADDPAINPAATSGQIQHQPASGTDAFGNDSHSAAAQERTQGPSTIGTQTLANGSHTAAAQDKDRQAVMPASRAEASDSGTTLTESSAVVDEAFSRAPAPKPAHGTHMATNHEHVGPVSAQMQDLAAAPSLHIAAQQHSQSQVDPQQSTNAPDSSPLGSPEQRATRTASPRGITGSPGAQAASPAATAASPGQRTPDIWKPVVDFDVHSITDVACMQLLPEFLQDISQVMIMNAMEHWSRKEPARPAN